MIIIEANGITSVVWGNEDPAWPAINSQDDHVGHVTRSTMQSDTMTITISGQGSSLYLGGVDAETADVTVKDAAGAVVDTHTIDFVSYADIEAFMFDDPRIFNDSWVEYAYQEADHSLEIVFTALSGSVPAVGVVRAGLGRRYYNPDWGIKAGLKDLSITERLASGGIYTVDRDVVRTWAGIIDLAPADADAWRFLDFKRRVRKRPFAALVVDSIDDRAHAAFVRFDDDPSYTMAGPASDKLRFRLIEEV